MDQYAADLADLVESLELRDAVLVGHSTGGRRGRALRRTPWDLTRRQAVLIGTVAPLML